MHINGQFLDHFRFGMPPFNPTNPRLLANPSHRHKRLLIYRRCFLIFPLLTYCCPRYIFFAQDGRRKGGVPEAEVVQNRQFISIDTFQCTDYYGTILSDYTILTTMPNQ